jgi:hypothetical protein
MNKMALEWVWREMNMMALIWAWRVGRIGTEAGLETGGGGKDRRDGSLASLERYG